MTPALRPNYIDHIAIAVGDSSSLDSTLANRIASEMVSYTFFTAGPDVYVRAIDDALRHESPITTLRSVDQQSFRSFLTMLSSALRSAAPWPRPAIIKLAPDGWEDFGHRIGTLDLTRIGAHHKLRQRFDTVLGGEQTQQVMLLQLRTGEQVGLIAPQDRTTRGIVLFTRGSDDSDSALIHFAELTGLNVKRED